MSETNTDKGWIKTLIGAFAIVFGAGGAGTAYIEHVSGNECESENEALEEVRKEQRQTIAGLQQRTTELESGLKDIRRMLQQMQQDGQSGADTRRARSEEARGQDTGRVAATVGPNGTALQAPSGPDGGESEATPSEAAPGANPPTPGANPPTPGANPVERALKSVDRLLAPARE